MPVPLAGETVSHVPLLVAVHAQVAPALTENVPVDPFGPTEIPVGASTYVQVDVAPACVTATVCPPIVSVAVRALVVVFAAAV